MAEKLLINELVLSKLDDLNKKFGTSEYNTARTDFISNYLPKQCKLEFRLWTGKTLYC